MHSAAAPHVRVVFELSPDDGWPPVGSERLWAIPLGPDRARLDNIPFFVRGVACGDVVRIDTDAEGITWVTEVVEVSGNCTIRILPDAHGDLEGSLQAVLDLFAPLGIEGERPAGRTRQTPAHRRPPPANIRRARRRARR
ncbi:DUF4265 domain-containing protein [Streptosporangium vulgare]|uniref:DUF4265 domain-containing protein n=1 Tax=Streptosporangium vulgare TaxID=46190 RepID=A0ABV5TU76_9ACTN